MTTFARCLPPRDADIAAANIFQKVLLHQNVPTKRDDEATQICYRKGWLHAEPLVDTDAQIAHRGEDIAFADLDRYAEHYLTGAIKPFP